ncbi:Ldh family oxidoreductase [Nonomuraea sp. K274]|uniref:Ldh family oxidoreductase n=1 Tax=Nonomuraea cypriaca TaxID=1187855 RepID=A0A931A7R5_9ACTN|nr:Ldh family oxidoreductase [Nonomuraea cypriaca]MBF8184979.1 Ldh family oxidoreductase [Nonomuraea cypriaca]
MTTITRQQLHDLAAAALCTAGLPADDAGQVADVLVLAELFGIRTHGVQRIPQYLERAHLGGIDLTAEITTDMVAPAMARVDGANGIGPLIGARALRAAMAGARATGIGAAFARHSNHFGPIMPYLFLAAQEGFATIIASNATTTIAPWGGQEARLGNNPIGLGVPRPGGDPLLLDIAMSVVARAKIRGAAKAGTEIPGTWATDRDGRPTTDPAEALEGFLQPIGGHKGYGLSLMIDLFAGLLSGAAYLDRVSSWSTDPERAQDLGHLFILVDTAPLMGGSELTERMTDFVRILHDTPATDPAVPVRVPGESEMAAYHRQVRDGVEVPDEDLHALRTLASLSEHS